MKILRVKGPVVFKPDGKNLLTIIVCRNARMEYVPGTSKKKHKKHCLRRIRDASSESSLFSSSESNFEPFKCHKSNRKSQSPSNRDLLTRIFEKKKLKDKSLSKKMKTPLDRKLYRTCWPIKLHKVSRIKEKPEEKRKEKPNHRSIMRKKFSNPTIIPKRIILDDLNLLITSRDIKFLEDEFLIKEYRDFNIKDVLFEHVTPEMLMKALMHPEHVESGATIDMIIKKLRNLKVDLNPCRMELKKDIWRKLHCAIKLGWVVESNGYYRVADDYKGDSCSKEKYNCVWRTWYRRMAKLRTLS